MIQDFLKEKIKEAGILQGDVAKRIGWTKQNVNYKLNHTGSKFASMLLIAEGIGLSCKIIDAETGEHVLTDLPIIENACEIEMSTEIFQSVLKTMGYDLLFDWKKPEDKLYMLTESNQDNELKTSV